MDSSKKIAEDFLRKRTALIQEERRRGLGARASRRYSGLMDQFIQGLFKDAGFGSQIRSTREEGPAVVALGSYGRKELCLGSDVDLLVIHQGKLTPDMRQVISQSLYPLWDAKLDVGHTILTIQECVRLAINDFKVLTAVMDARYLLGSRVFYHLFESAFWSRVEREKASLLKYFLIAQQRREDKYGHVSYFSEPDIKEGLGGLRDLHIMKWIARIYLGVNRLRDIQRFQVFSHFDLHKLAQSKSFLIRLRNHLHHLTGRKEDRMLLSYQESIAESLGYQSGPIRTAAEKTMRQLHRHQNRIQFGSEEFRVKALDIIEPALPEHVSRRISPDLKVYRDSIVLEGDSLSGKDPLLILQAFHEANRQSLGLGSGFIWEARKRIRSDGRGLLETPGSTALFLRMILAPKNPKIIRIALEIGLISLFIPEFKQIRNLAQYGFYHVATMDIHALKTIEILNDMAEGRYDEQWPLLKEVFSGLDRPERLYLAGLLHDIGKGYKGDHAKRGAAMVPRILKRLGLDGDTAAVISFLIRNHLLLANTSQRRDLNDEKTSIQVAQEIQDIELLEPLFLLTVADSLATGPMASSDWKIMLLIELFHKVRNILEQDTLATADSTKTVEENRAYLMDALRPRHTKTAVTNLMDQVSTRYFLNTPREDMIRHFRMAMDMGDDKLVWTLDRLSKVPVTRVILCSYDRPGLFSKLIGIFTLNNIQVLSANIFTLKNGLAFDTYEVTNPIDPYREEEIWQKIKNQAIQAIEELLPLDEMIEKKDPGIVPDGPDGIQPIRIVKINNQVSDFFTTIEVRAKGRFGLLYELAKEIHALGLDIRFARINQDKERLTGVFYVRDAEGQKIYGEGLIDRTRNQILSIIGGALH